MSTRSVIARKTESGFRGVYHHWDGYPSGLGQTLFNVRRWVFGGDTNSMLAYLIDAHPAGWSTVNGCRWFDARPRCYCHNDRNEPPCEMTEANASGSGCEYVYVFDAEGSRMTILSSHSGSAKMIGMFGLGDPEAHWVEVKSLDLDSEVEPEWSAFDGK